MRSKTHCRPAMALEMEARKRLNRVLCDACNMIRDELGLPNIDLYGNEAVPDATSTDDTV
jgi:hypothetical protein